MNTPDSSHAEGVWERQIRTMKNVLASTLASSAGRLDDASWRTFLYETMSIVNSCPFTVDTLSDPTKYGTINTQTAHYETLSVLLPPPGKFIKEELYAKKQWRRVLYLAEQFCNKWKKEYVTNISLRQ